jgi:hypothetical protein
MWWRRPRWSLALAAVLAAGCSKSKTEHHVVDLSLDLTHCLGDVRTGKLDDGTTETTCRSALDGLVAPDGVNACLLIQEADDGPGGKVHYVPLKWQRQQGKASTLEPTGKDVPEIPVAAGKRVRAELYLGGPGFKANLCADGGLAYGSMCGADTFCVLKLTNADTTIAEDGKAVINFAGQQGCNETWADMQSAGETCDGKDNDCDGRVDEDFADLQRECHEGVGACQRAGHMVCTDDGMGTRCDAVPGQPADQEICDEIDNNCDGTTDEGLPPDCLCHRGAVKECGVGKGICVRGHQTCMVEAGQDTGTLGPCLDDQGHEVIKAGDQQESCNGLDDDCDGTVDNGFNLGMRCKVGEGECSRDGAIACAPDGTATCDATAGNPTPEVCDNLDNDCDGQIDNGLNVGMVCADGVGACRREGMTVCGPDGSVACNAQAAPPGDELCGDQIDNNCDGDVDEGFDTLGQPCTVGVGACQQTGRVICNPQDLRGTTCDRQPLQPHDEICDNLDNDCDGHVDEGFDVQTDPLNCGRCGNPCALPNAQPHCGGGVCILEPADCIGGFRDQDGVVANGCECNPGASDAPDPGPEFTDTNCDNVDGDASRAVFVSADHGNDQTGTGRINAPYRTLVHGVDVAQLVGAAVYLDAGTYDLEGQTLVVPAGVNIYGGYRFDPNDNSWRRGTRDVNPSIISGATVAIRFNNLDADTMLDNVVVRSADAAANESSVGILATNVGEHLTLRNVRIEAGDGGHGTDGQDGADGAHTAANGLPGFTEADGSCPGCGGDPGTNNGCPNGTSGGHGGDGGRSRGRDDRSAQNGDNGAGMGGGMGGPLGAAGMSGQDGHVGADGGHGPNASAGGPDGRIDAMSQLWVPRFGGVAGNGTAGTGGGGGGGGGSIDGHNGIGGGGGGGGAGGCYGTGGRAASSGGGSFALQIIGGNVHLQSCELHAGDGGDGGNGGTGGQGAPGSAGQAGGGHPNCAGCGGGGRGGDGGRGGCGGNSGAGAGGPSFALFRVSTDQRAANLSSSTVVYQDYAGHADANQAAAAGRTLQNGQPGHGGAGGGADQVGCGMAAQAGADGRGGPEGCCRAGIPAPDCGDLTVCAAQ